MTRRERARALAERFPAAGEALLFYGEIAEFDGDLEDLRRLVRRVGPAMLRDAAARATPESLDAEPDGFFARVLKRRAPERARVAVTNLCPQCGHPPQCGVLRKEGDGRQLHLLCGRCLHEWAFPRAHCPACPETNEERIGYYVAEGMPHLRTRVCDTCGRYLHVIDCVAEPEAIPDVDEIAALAMDVWAVEQGWEKICPNLIGI